MNPYSSPPGFRRAPLAHIDAVVALRLGPARVKGNARAAVFNRQIAMYLAKRVGGWSTTRIGNYYHGRDHSTVCHAIRKVDALRTADPGIAVLIDSFDHGTVPKPEGRRRYEPSTDYDIT